MTDHIAPPPAGAPVKRAGVVIGHATATPSRLSPTAPAGGGGKEMA
ncbi:hypothetical protein Uis4E_1517 [Bifidobacterium parmae]|uniref:Uncharacterized protein n=1 Tax=Bifidobacterium parmae TaxID=361854 RepID=A0A2N5IZV1_9BIFI|nr:hypothetical protein Uis4E_1517 [Bifidobacterium parmae]